MSKSRIDRRDFHQLTAAALGGLAAGTLLGCTGGGSTDPGSAASDKHLCRGLNECKGQGKGGDNACRGQGACATVAESSCGGQNACKGLGGCGANVGANDCKGKGGCHVPLMESAWDTLRKRKEAEWSEKKVEFGKEPASADAEPMTEPSEPTGEPKVEPAESSEPMAEPAAEASSEPAKSE